MGTMAIRRRSRTWRRRSYRRTYTRTAAVARREDRRYVQKTEGKWYSFMAYQELTPTSTIAGGSAFIDLPIPAEMETLAKDGNYYHIGQRGITVYGLNSLITLSSVQAYSTDKPILGGMAATVLRYDEGHSDLPRPLYFGTNRENDASIQQSAASIDNRRPWRWVQPFVVDLSEGAPRRSLAIPFSFRRSHRVYLPRGLPGGVAPTQPSRFTLAFSAHGEGKLGISWHGRYRFIERSV